MNQERENKRQTERKKVLIDKGKKAVIVRMGVEIAGLG